MGLTADHVAGAGDHVGDHNLIDAALADRVLAQLGGQEKVRKVLAAGAAHTFDLSLGNVQDLTLTAPTCTLTFPTVTAPGRALAFTVIARQDATGGRLVSYPTSVAFADGVTPGLTNTPNAVDLLTFLSVDGGASWLGFGGAVPPPAAAPATFDSATLNVTTYRPASIVSVATTSNVFADIDATNLKVTFTVPASGKVVLSAQGFITPATSTTYSWAWRNSGGNVMVQSDVSFGGSPHMARIEMVAAGLTPGSVQTWTLAHALTFGSTSNKVEYGGTRADAVLKVISA